MNLIQKNILIAACFSGVLLVALVAHGQTSVGIAPKTQTAPVLAPAEAPIMGTASNQSADVSVAYNKFVFPNTLPEGNLPLTAGAMFTSVLTTGINPLLVALVGLLVIIGYAQHRKVAQKN